MILRRLVDHVKSQHWTMVFLDFVIVVLGVFIGLQAQDWNSARNARADAREYRQGLITDMELSVSRNQAEDSYEDTDNDDRRFRVRSRITTSGI